MKRSIRFALMFSVMALVIGLVPNSLESTATACPSCKNANDTTSNRPRAYMYSILFMLGMPATVFTCFGVAFYRMSKNQPLNPELDALLTPQHDDFDASTSSPSA